MVNERPITHGEIRMALEPISRRLRQQYDGAQLIDRLDSAYESILQSAIERALILEEFATKEVQIPPQAVDEHVQFVVSEDFGGSRTALLQTLAEEGLSMQEWRDQIRDNIAINMMRGEFLRPMITAISPRQLRIAYEERIDDFKTQPATWVWIITLRNSTEEISERNERTAAEIVEALRGGADFSEQARTHSTDTFASQGGDRGWIDPQHYLRSDLADIAATLEPGQVSDPIPSVEAWYIVKVADRREASVQSFDDVRDDLVAELRQAEEQRAYRAWIARLRNRHHVHVFSLETSNDSF